MKSLAELKEMGFSDADLAEHLYKARKKNENLLNAYFKVHDIISDLMERGVLTEEMIPDDYQALLVALEAAAILGHKAGYDKSEGQQ